MILLFSILILFSSLFNFDLIISYAKSFLDHEYANYVIQYIISKNIPYYNEILLSLIMENMLKYSKNKSSIIGINIINSYFWEKYQGFVSEFIV